ncbi:MAG: glycosyltransferase involved in cell wall biosynthesis [Arenicella sp.]|jgi:glycosyltransferase involved in cell wall biosynthesis
MTSLSPPKITVCTITPVYCGETYLVDLAHELEKVRNGWAESDAPLKLTEAIFVDDGSIDSSSAILANLANKYSWITIVSLSRNFGQHAATVAGICHSSSDWVVTLDEDLQHKPKLINDLFTAQAQHSADIVYAKPKQSAHGNSWRDKSSHSVKKIIAKLTSTPQIEMFNSFRLIRGSIARAAASSSSRSTYFDIAISWFTKSACVTELDLHDDRFTNNQSSGYGFTKLVQHARRLIVSAELDIASTGLVVGFISILFAFLLATITIFQKLFFPETIDSVGWTSLMIVATFFGGIVIALLCISLEYIHILVLNNLGKPTFFRVERDQDRLLRQWFGQ